MSGLDHKGRCKNCGSLLAEQDFCAWADGEQLHCSSCGELIAEGGKAIEVCPHCELLVDTIHPKEHAVRMSEAKREFREFDVGVQAKIEGCSPRRSKSWADALLEWWGSAPQNRGRTRYPPPEVGAPFRAGWEAAGGK